MSNLVSILFVDDEKELLSILEKRMKKRGFVVYTAPDGRRALRILDRHHVDVTVLDVKMPGLDGIETLLEIKKRKPGVAVIMLTGHACIDSARQGLEAGAFDYLMKPVNLTELIYRIEDALAGRPETWTNGDA